MRLLLIIGPPAVGKMAVGREIAAQSEFRLFHNHHTIEPLIEVFGYGTAPFNVLNSEFRRRVIEEAARNNVDLIFTLVWNLADPADTTYVEQLVAPFNEAAGEIWVLELTADLERGYCATGARVGWPPCRPSGTWNGRTATFAAWKPFS